MRLLIPRVLIIAGIVVTVVMWISGNGFYLTYIPAASGDGISQYSPLWILAAELVAAYSLFVRKLWGGVFLFGPALAVSIDIYPAWMILGKPDISLIYHIIVAVSMWGAGISGVVAYRYLE